LFLLIIVYTLSSTKLEIRAKQFLPRSEGVGQRGRGWGKKGWVGGNGGEMTQRVYAPMNKRGLEEFSSESTHSQTFVFGIFFITSSISRPFIVLFKWFIASWLNFSRSYVSKLSISFRFCSL
jgi:hypothetical protein